jgi:hypothetical protein
MGQPKGGKGGGKPAGKQGGKQGGKPAGKQGGKQNAKQANKQSGKTNKQAGKNQKKADTKSYSSVSSGICLCLSIMYSSVIAYLGGTAIKTVGENPELIRMAAMASDSRLKKNVKQMNYGLNEITQLEPKSYNYITEQDKTTRHLGLMAQDLQEVMPELVLELDDSNNKSTTFRNSLPKELREESLYGVKYQELVPVLINAIKELKHEVDTLKQQIHQ